mmetsp:Transcript_35497/g.84758  ORF Transcript_35497/g.84758 Transcript_35497/m.84758 type:complete len:104 (-) Transcript_35497:5108-5419(-)
MWFIVSLFNGGGCLPTSGSQFIFVWFSCINTVWQGTLGRVHVNMSDMALDYLTCTLISIEYISLLNHPQSLPPQCHHQEPPVVSLFEQSCPPWNPIWFQGNPI